jgi:hypothetical protein
MLSIKYLDDINTKFILDIDKNLFTMENTDSVKKTDHIENIDIKYNNGYFLFSDKKDELNLMNVLKKININNNNIIINNVKSFNNLLSGKWDIKNNISNPSLTLVSIESPNCKISYIYYDDYFKNDRLQIIGGKSKYVNILYKDIDRNDLFIIDYNNKSFIYSNDPKYINNYNNNQNNYNNNQNNYNNNQNNYNNNQNNYNNNQNVNIPTLAIRSESKTDYSKLILYLIIFILIIIIIGGVIYYSFSKKS